MNKTKGMANGRRMSLTSRYNSQPMFVPNILSTLSMLVPEKMQTIIIGEKEKMTNVGNDKRKE